MRLFPYLITWHIFFNLIRDSLSYEQLLAKPKMCVFLSAFCFSLDSQAGQFCPLALGVSNFSLFPVWLVLVHTVLSLGEFWWFKLHLLLGWSLYMYVNCIWLIFWKLCLIHIIFIIFFFQGSELSWEQINDFGGNPAFLPPSKLISLQRQSNGFGFTLRHFVVYPPELIRKSSEVRGYLTSVNMF